MTNAAFSGRDADTGRKRLRIAQVITPSRIAGAERSTLRLCRELRQRGHEVCLVSKSGAPIVRLAGEEGIKAHGLRISGKLNALAPVRLAAFLRRWRADVVATQLSTASLWGGVAGKMLGTPVVATVRALNTKTCFALADRVIAVSHAVRDHLTSQRMAGHRVEVVHNGVDLARFQPTSDAHAAKRVLGVEADGLLLGVVAHLSKKKGHSWFLRAAASAVKRSRHTRVALVGDGPERQAIAAEAARLGIADRLLMPGFREDVRPWLAAMDVVVLPSTAKEGFGRVLVEAGAMAKPVIASDVGGSAEVVDHERTGLCVPAGNAAQLAAAIDRLAMNRRLREEMGAAGRRRAEKCFSVEQSTDATLAVYQRVIAAREARARRVGGVRRLYPAIEPAA